MDQKLPKVAAHGRLTGVLPRQRAFARRRRAEGWQRRRGGLQPWRRGRIRPSTCRDFSEGE